MRHVFFSFDWDDVWRVNQVRNSWVTQGSYTMAGFVDRAEIETLKRKTDQAIKQWINNQMDGTSVTCVLIGSSTANSKWVQYEIEKSIEKRNGLLGVHIHKVKNQRGNTDTKGKSPFSKRFGWVTNYDWVNHSGYDNLGDWIEEAADQAGR